MGALEQPTQLSACLRVDCRTYFDEVHDRDAQHRMLKAMFLLGRGFVDAESQHRQELDVEDLNISAIAKDALDRNGITSLQQLVSTDPDDLRLMVGVDTRALVVELARAGWFLSAPTTSIESTSQLCLEYSAEWCLRSLGPQLFVELAEELFYAGRFFSVEGGSVAAYLPLGALDFSRRTRNCFEKAGFTVVRDVVARSPASLMQIPNFGLNSLRNVISVLARSGTFLGDTRILEIEDLDDVQSQADAFKAHQRSLVVELLAAGANLSTIALKSGTTIDEVRLIANDEYGSSSLTVIRAENRRRAKANSNEPDPRQERLERIIELRLQGQSMRQIGEQFGVTAEAIRRMLSRHQELLDLRQAETEQLLVTKLAEGIESGGSLSETSSSTGKSESEILEMLPTHVLAKLKDDFVKFLIDNRELPRESTLEQFGISIGAARQLAGTAIDRLSCPSVLRGSLERLFTDEEILDALRNAAQHAVPLTTSAYTDLVQSGEVEGPSVATIHLRFETWAQACTAAGVQPGEAWDRAYERKWSQSDLETYVCDYLAEPSSKGSFTDFEMWLAKDEARPSGVLVRNRLGGWTNAKKQALISDYMTVLLASHRQ